MSHLTTLDECRLRLNQFQHPSLISDWADDSVIVASRQGKILLTLPFVSASLQRELPQWINAQDSLSGVEFQFSQRVKPLKTNSDQRVKGVKNIIAVTSAKGGVGKSTTAANCALALAQCGAKVGLLDADIYGPSVPIMFGTRGIELEVRDGKWMQPYMAHGIATHSIGYLVDENDAAIWRGPMASKALSQLLNETEWPDLDYLVIDMPPGTGDIQLTLAQQIPVTGAVVVTTPQDLALADAKKGIAMFHKVNVPVVGLIENMSYHVCSHCGHHDDIFGTGGAQEISQELGISLLGQIPLHRQLREDIDSGIPTVAARPESEFSHRYVSIAEQISSQMYWVGEVAVETIPMTFT
jgi:ATP-binding protein involved in chromosome partitioning